MYYKVTSTIPALKITTVTTDTTTTTSTLPSLATLKRPGISTNYLSVFVTMRKIMLLIAAVAASLALFNMKVEAQNKGDNRPYNLQKAYEVLQQDHDEEQAIRLLEDQLKSTPGDAECWMLLCRIYRNRNESGKALSSVNEAIKVNRPKKSGYYMSTLYWWKACIYDEMDENAKEIEWLRKALDQARKDNKDHVQDISFDLGQALYEEGDYDASDAVYRQMLKENEADQSAMIGLARNMMKHNDYKDAVDLLDRCQKYGADYSQIYRFRANAYDKLGETDKAIDDIMEWFETDEDASMYDSVIKILLKHRSYAIARAKSMMKTSDRKDDLRIVLIGIYQESCDYANALREYDALEDEYGRDEFIYYERADCYDEMGLADLALQEIDKALELEDDYSNNVSRGCILRAAGRYEEARKSFDRAIEIEPTDAYAYYAKGWCYELSGDDGRALECYEQGIDVDKSYAYIYLMRGEQYLKAGHKDMAEEDFMTILQMDTVVTDGSCRQYALHLLGRDQEADEWMQKIIDEEPYKFGHWYDKACLYSRMGRYDEAVKALETALEMGYAKFLHIEHDDDMDGIRGREDFKALIGKYRARHAERTKEMGIKDISEEEAVITEVPISRHSGGTFDVACQVNGLALSMIFDTGASDVSISKVEADFMFKNNYISREDVRGKRYYQTADGGISEGTLITLKEVKIGDAVIRNVEASVSKSQKAPLLLGESVLQKFGTFTVDNINSKLIIKQ